MTHVGVFALVLHIYLLAPSLRTVLDDFVPKLASGLQRKKEH